ncbi:hypothetical protein [Bacillus sp. MUM 13]|uniref:hypothetical protein n=1 Tax=Bacillus sp. MUM 13 TaxID=1678001 RepID=UPI0008F56253|nr:hypothetical protein [Bacillus sp. MUM 13]OIK14319.1 hypothetical protein BIV59_03445 [Bacillus sp. MUM 13]
MKNNYTVAFLMLFVASIAGGLALKNVFDYSMIVGVGLGTVFLLCSTFFAGKSQKNSKAQ